MTNSKNPGKGRKRKRVLRRIVGILILIIVLGGVGVYAWAKLRDQYTVTYDEYTATTGTISNSLSFTGSLALKDSKTYTASSGGTVRNVYVQNGDAVKKGDRLIRMSNGTLCTADFDATVNQVSVAVGDEVSAGDTLVQIADFAHMQVSFRVDEYDINDVAVGDACTVTATATEKTFTSAIDTINYISSSTGNVAYYTATANVNADGQVYPGMQVTVTIPQEEAKDVVILKADALSFSLENQAFVYKMKEDQTLEQTEVEVGVSNGNYVEIKSGLKSGETVYVESKTEENTLASMFSSMFGQQQFNRQNGTRNSENRQRNWNGTGNGTAPQMPSGGNSGGNGGGR